MLNRQIMRDLKILLVEDETKLLHLLKETLKNYCATIITAKDGQEGFEKYLKTSPDVIITDIMMPNVDGLRMSEKVKEHNSTLPIIVLSAFGNQDKLLKAIDIGINKYFIKPLDVEEFMSYISLLSEKIDKQKVTKLADSFIFRNNTKTLFKNDALVKLTKREVIFLDLLLKSDNNSLHFDNIKEKLWKDDIAGIDRVRTFVKRFREKTSKKLISNVSGQGYMLNVLSKNNIQ